MRCGAASMAPAETVGKGYKMRTVPFAKVESSGNDFLVVPAGRDAGWWTPARVRSICDRRLGMGADGLIVLGRQTSRGIRFHLFNCDGSRAEWSGNGVRGAAALLAGRGSRDHRYLFLTAAGEVPVTVRRHGRLFDAAFERPLPLVADPHLRGLRAKTAAGPWAVDAGNPHWVFVVRNFDLPWEDIGANCQRHLRARRTAGVNVEFVRVVSRGRIELRLFERGVGPTASSGSGALAALAACWHQELLDATVRVMSPGGVQRARLDRMKRRVELSAPARVVCQGVWSCTP